jgi:hypothetical protein
VTGQATPQPRACLACGAPAADHGGITQCTANPAHIDVHDLAAIKFPVTLRRKPGSPESRTRPDGLPEGERTAIGWARKSHGQWGGKGRGVADSMRQQWPWLDDAELARIALYFGTILEHAHGWSWHGLHDLDVISWARVLKAAALEMAHLELDNPGLPEDGQQ